MKILGIIPARGGSKGVPNKNTKLLGGKPLIAYTIESAKHSRLLTDFIVSTDSNTIAETAKTYGADIPFMRPTELATDTAKSIDVVLHALNEMQQKGKSYDAVILLQPTYPFRPEGFIDQAIQQFISSGNNSLISVLPVPHEYNPHWVFEPDNKGFLHLATGEKEIIPRRQDLPPAFFRDGSIYITTTEVLKNNKSFYGNHLGYIVAHKDRYVNIDTLEDWERAEELIETLLKHGGQ